MKIQHSIILLLSLIIFSCSDDIKILEEKIKLQAEKNNTEISKVDIKKTALYLNAWSKEDFYQEAVDEFLSQDLVNPPPKGGILFTGSSSIRFWNTLQEDMEPMLTINRGFGGAHIAHVIHHFDDVITNYQPKAIVFISGTNDIVWHPSGSTFVGSGISINNVPFTYHANWTGPGRWAVEVITSKRRFFLKPMEALFYQSLGSVEINQLPIDDRYDIDFKPGLFRQVENFLNNDFSLLQPIGDQLEMMSYYESIAGYN